MKKRINVYEDGKLSRAIYAEIIEEDTINDEFKIKFTTWENTNVEWWFYCDRKGVYTCYDDDDHWNTNYWYFPARETYDFALECCEWFVSEYWKEYFSHLLEE